MIIQMNKICVEKSKDLGKDQQKNNFINELIDVVHKTAESGLSLTEAKDILCLLASDWYFLIRIYFVIFVFVFFFNQKLCFVCTFLYCAMYMPS